MFDLPAYPQEFVEVGNRSTKPLSIMYGGRQYKVPPHPKTVMLPAIVAVAGLNQNPVMGTENPYNPHDVQYLLYVKEWSKLPQTPIEQSEKIERIDRSLLPPDAQNVTKLSGFGRPVIERAVDSPNVTAGFEADRT
jgi:hypothetical protein